MSFGLCLGGVTEEGTMICNLPLLFADGYPTCLEKITVSQLEKFVPFMVQCSSGRDSSRKMTAPEWWPENLKFSFPLVKPPGEESKWLAILKNLVCRCYTYHGCEFMLRFCIDLSQCPTAELSFVDSWNGTTSLYNQVSGKLLVTFRNENMSYDRKKESPRKTLLPKIDADIGRSQIAVQPPLFDIYLCDNCDGEFSSLKEVQEHEKLCCREHAVDSPHSSAEDSSSELTDQEKFLNYFDLGCSAHDEVKRSAQKVDPPRYKRAVGNSLRYTGIPCSSPLGLLVHKKIRPSPEAPRELERTERYCCNKSPDANSRSRDSRHTDFWPISWKPRKKTDEGEDWVHMYKLPKRQWRRRAPFMQTELSERSCKLLANCRPLQINLKRLTAEEIEWHTTPRSVTPCISIDHCTEASGSAVDYHGVFTSDRAAYSNVNHYSSFDSLSTYTSYSSFCNQRENSFVRSHEEEEEEVEEEEEEAVAAASILKRRLKGTDFLSSEHNPSYIDEPSELEYVYSDHVVNGEAIEPVNSATKLGSEFSFESQLVPNTLYVYDTSLSVRRINNEVSAIPVIDLCSSDDENDSSCKDISGQFSNLRPSGIVSKVTNYGCLSTNTKDSVLSDSRVYENEVIPVQSSDYRSGLPRLMKLLTPSMADYYPNHEAGNCVYASSVSSVSQEETRPSKDKPSVNSQHMHFQSRSQGDKSLLASCGYVAAHRAFPQEYSPVEAEVACEVPVQEGSDNWMQDLGDFHCSSNIEKLPKLQKHRRGL